jgi:hypothetical protein
MKLEQRLETKLKLTKEILINDYNELGSLVTVGEKYNIGALAVARIFKRLEVPYKQNICHNINKEYFSNFDNPDMFYWLGFLTADGNIYKGRLTLVLAIKDYQHIEKFKNDLEFSGSIINILNKGSERNSKWNDTESCGIRFCSKEIINDLNLFNISPQKTYKTIFPKNIP